jgi:hypothetical protein
MGGEFNSNLRIMAVEKPPSAEIDTSVTPTSGRI